jgi:hypothetical protein
MTLKEIDGPAIAGCYKTRIVKGGVYVPVLIYRVCCCTIGGSVDHEWTDLCDRFPQPPAAKLNGKPGYLNEVWGRAQWFLPISREQYDFMLADAIWCEQYAADDPKANPERAVDLNLAKPIF